MGQLQEKYKSYRVPQDFMEKGIYPYFREITGKQGTEVEMGGHKVLMFGSNAYTGLTGDQRIVPQILDLVRVSGNGKGAQHQRQGKQQGYKLLHWDRSFRYSAYSG